jgi:hypothetical protein
MNALLAPFAGLNYTIDKSFTTSLQVNDAEEAFLSVQYSNPPNNNFSSNNLYVFFAQEGSSTLPNTNAMATATAPAGGGQMIGQTGGGTFGALPYLIAYSLNPAVTTAGVTTYADLVSTVYIPGVPIGDPTQIIPFAPSLAISSVQPTIASFQYNLPPGFDPSQGAWIGVWAGHKPPYGGSPTAAAPITLPQSGGASPVMMPRTAPFASKGPYTAALFSSGWSTNPANLPTQNVASYIYFSTTGKVGGGT